MSLKAERVQITENGFRYFKVESDDENESYPTYSSCTHCRKTIEKSFYIIPWYNDAEQAYCQTCFNNWLTWGDIQEDFGMEKMRSDIISRNFGHPPPTKNYSCDPNEFYWDRKKHGDPTW